MILCCGEALIDMLPRKSEQGEPAFAPYAGGAVFNTAIALGRLGVPTGLFSGLSTDLTTLFFGGISLVNDPAASAYVRLQARAASSRVTMIDPNIRPGFIRDEASYRARLDQMLGLADIVKLSDEDLHWLQGESGDLETLARTVLAKGPKLLFITEGAKGAHAFTATQTRFVASKKVVVADTVGAGDTFNAGALAALYQADALSKTALNALPDATIDTALALGGAAAAITVSRPGANPPWDHEL